MPRQGGIVTDMTSHYRQNKYKCDANDIVILIKEILMLRTLEQVVLNTPSNCSCGGHCLGGREFQSLSTVVNILKSYNYHIFLVCICD